MPIINDYERKTIDAYTQTEPEEPISVEECSCPITGHRDPDFVALVCGHVFSRIGILQWFHKNKTCAICREPASTFYSQTEIRNRIRKLENAAGKLDQIHEANSRHMNKNPKEWKELEEQKATIERKLGADPIPNEAQGFDYQQLTLALRESNRLERSRQTIIKVALVVCLSMAGILMLTSARGRI